MFFGEQKYINDSKFSGRLSAVKDRHKAKIIVKATKLFSTNLIIIFRFLENQYFIVQFFIINLLLSLLAVQGMRSLIIPHP